MFLKKNEGWKNKQTQLDCIDLLEAAKIAYSQPSYLHNGEALQLPRKEL